MVDINSIFELCSFLFSCMTQFSFVFYLLCALILPFLLYSLFSYLLRGNY